MSVKILIDLDKLPQIISESVQQTLGAHGADIGEIEADGSLSGYDHNARAARYREIGNNTAAACLDAGGEIDEHDAVERVVRTLRGRVDLHVSQLTLVDLRAIVAAVLEVEPS